MPKDQGRWRLLNPLCIRFSQPRIAPHFRDGHLLEDTAVEVLSSGLDFGGALLKTAADAADGTPCYDSVLIPPFPAIRVISWLPKIRRPDGEAERDANGDQIMGKRAWFALDNRRLHSMQVAAAKRWPQRCCVIVLCIEEVPGELTVKELRKFRTTTQGRTVDIGVRAGETRLFSWTQVLRPGTCVEPIEPEGLFAEDLWDAVQWAPRAVAAASRGGPGGVEDCSPSPSPRLEIEKPHNQKTQHERPSPAGRAPEATGLQKMRTILEICPGTGWQYIDPAGKIQGPFGLEKMRLWQQHGFFYPDLPMRCNDADMFLAFKHLWPAGLLPFQSHVLRCLP